MSMDRVDRAIAAIRAETVLVGWRRIDLAEALMLARGLDVGMTTNDLTAMFAHGRIPMPKWLASRQARKAIRVWVREGLIDVCA